MNILNYLLAPSPKEHLAKLAGGSRSKQCSFWCGVTHPPVEDRIKALREMSI